MSLGRMGTLQEHIVVRIGTFPKTFGGPDPERLLADGEKSLLNHVVTAPKPGTANHFFVFREDITAHAKLNDTARSQPEHPGRRSERLQQCGDEDIGIEHNPDHWPDCGWSLRRARRAAAISASISSIER